MWPNVRPKSNLMLEISRLDRIRAKLQESLSVFVMPKFSNENRPSFGLSKVDNNQPKPEILPLTGYATTNYFKYYQK